VERIIAERVIDANGNPYVVVVDFPEPSVLSRPLFELLSADFSGRPTRASAVRLAAVVGVAGLFCFVLARHIAAPIDRLRSATKKIAREQLETRIDRDVLNRGDELADLGRDFNGMADRIEHLVTAQRQLLSDVSHALRSPLARLNVALGLARRHSVAGIAEHLDRIELETERLNTLIGQLLTMARVDSGVGLVGCSAGPAPNSRSRCDDSRNHTAGTGYRYERQCRAAAPRNRVRGLVLSSPDDPQGGELRDRSAVRR